MFRKKYQSTRPGYKKNRDTVLQKWNWEQASWANQVTINTSKLKSSSPRSISDSSATGRYGDGGHKCFPYEKTMFSKYRKSETTKDVCLISVFVFILTACVVSLAPGVCNTSVRPWPCV